MRFGGVRGRTPPVPVGRSGVEGTKHSVSSVNEERHRGFIRKASVSFGCVTPFFLSDAYGQQFSIPHPTKTTIPVRWFRTSVLSKHNKCRLYPRLDDGAEAVQR